MIKHPHLAIHRWREKEVMGNTRDLQRTTLEGGAMGKRYGRPSPHYRYEHYDPRF
jgi:hypothetical protein